MSSAPCSARSGSARRLRFGAPPGRRRCLGRWGLAEVALRISSAGHRPVEVVAGDERGARERGRGGRTRLGGHGRRFHDCGIRRQIHDRDLVRDRRRHARPRKRRLADGHGPRRADQSRRGQLDVDLEACRRRGEAPVAQAIGRDQAPRERVVVVQPPPPPPPRVVGVNDVPVTVSLLKIVVLVVVSISVRR